MNTDRTHPTRASILASDLLCALLLTFAYVPHAAAGSTEDFARAEKSMREGDVARALPILKRLADGGYAPAQSRLADLYDKAEENVAAVAYYRKAAEQGDAQGLFGLASMYAAGEGVERNMQESLRLIRQAGEQGHVPAIHAMANAYIVAEPALKDSSFSTQALHWSMRAAETGYVPAMDALTRAYQTGQWGVAADQATAQAWKQKADAARRALANQAAQSTSEKP